MEVVGPPTIEKSGMTQYLEIVQGRKDVHFFVTQEGAGKFACICENYRTYDFFCKYPEIHEIIGNMLNSYDLNDFGAASIERSICINGPEGMQLLKINMELKSTSDRIKYLEGEITDLTVLVESATVAHDLRTPLTKALGYLDLLMEGQFDSEMAMERMDHNLHRAAEIVTYYLNNFRLLKDRGRYKNVSLSDLIDEVVGDLSELIRDSSASIKRQIDSSAVLFGARVGLSRLLENLIKNAIIHNGENPQIEIRYELEDTEAGRDAVVSIWNNAVIPSEMQERIFTFNINSNNGFGLGLFICYSICRAMNGRIRFESNSDQGTTFYIAFPLPQEESS